MDLRVAHALVTRGDDNTERDARREGGCTRLVTLTFFFQGCFAFGTVPTTPACISLLNVDTPPLNHTMTLEQVSPGSDRLAVIGTEPSCILLYDLATMVLKGRLGKPGHRGGRFVSGVGGGGGGMLQPWRHRSGSFDGAGAAVVADSGAAAAAAGGGFLHAAFSGDGADLLACTATKFFRFPLGGG